jgi:hypothetical protein
LNDEANKNESEKVTFCSNWRKRHSLEFFAWLFRDFQNAGSYGYAHHSDEGHFRGDCSGVVRMVYVGT